jgi:hypothetical protein
MVIVTGLVLSELGLIWKAWVDGMSPTRLTSSFP